jgi:hypothetical protein
VDDVAQLVPAPLRLVERREPAAGGDRPREHERTREGTPTEHRPPPGLRKRDALAMPGHHDRVKKLGGALVRRVPDRRPGRSRAQSRPACTLQMF